MPRGSKDAYTDTQKRQAEHIESGYEQRGLSKDESKRRAWATVNKASGGGKQSGSGRGHAKNPTLSSSDSSMEGLSASAASRSAAAKKGWQTRRRQSHA